MQDCIISARYCGSTLIHLRQFIEEYIDSITAELLIDNLGRVFRKIFNSGIRQFITMGDLKNELYDEADQLMNELIYQQAMQIMIEETL